MGEPLSRWRTLYRRARAYFAVKGPRYWLMAAVILAASVILTPWTTQLVDVSPVNYWLFQRLTQLAPRSTKPRYTSLVYIDDDVHRKELGDRVPLRRDYLARIVHALDMDNVRLIALDFRLQAVDPSKPVQPGDFSAIGEYRTETDELMREIAHAAKNRKVVLPFMLLVDEKKGTVPTSFLVIQQAYGMCVKPLKNGGWWNPGAAKYGFALDDDAKANITCGYINLPGDLRQVPPPTAIRDGAPVDSLSLAIARAIDPDNAGKIDEANASERTIFASYFSQDALVPGKTIISTEQLLSTNPQTQRLMKRLLESKAVVVGGHWQTGLPGSGEFVDMFYTPAGWISGALIHQNFAEAILDDRMYSELAPWFFEIVFAVGAALVFAIISSIWKKLAIIAGAVVMLVFYEWAVFFLFGIFVDAFLPVLGLGLHSLIERLFEPRHDNHPAMPPAEREPARETGMGANVSKV